MCIGQPRVQWEQRHFHRKGNHKTCEQPATRIDREVCLLGNFKKIKGEITNIAARKKRSSDNAHQHERRTRHGVNEKLRCGIDALVVAPVADEEIHRHKHNFEEHKEQEKIEAEEATHHASLEDEHPHEILLVVVMWINPHDDKREKNSRQHHEEQRNTINA